MIDPSEKVLRAVLNLEGSEDFQTFLGWCRESYQKQLEENTEILEDFRLRWGQGKAQQISDLLTTLANARTLYSLKRK